ncbi:MAG: radical SAM protein [Kiritimatiellae bacterium]|nr:radical SAM protein [Kiritimatiellia bacterium]
MKMTRKEFIAVSAAYAACGPLTVASAAGRAAKTPLMLDTKRMAIHDGPGIRTTFFVKGCPLKCIWCHNPESIDVKPQTARFRHLCRNCAKCTMDEATCPTRALKFYGKPMTIDEIVAKALEDKAFYDESGGGVTLSGGEPLFFWEWAAELFAAFKKAGLHTCLDTSLYAPPAAIDALLPVTDLWLPDYKADDDALHVKYTGVSNGAIKKNLERLVAAKAKLEVRCLVVPGCTDGDDIVARHRYLDSIGIPESSIVNLEYYDYARSKYLALGMKDTMPPKRENEGG